ncbi:unnamed protein product [Rotaria sordida]|uniref:F-box domain-containing protein n=1 Tax=Rotaria sordida TaxID=392033 RepID=A0A814U372_9BILA|nr:unnamed protein product [Rotaria sordida]CAF3900293.1 unnamed protein product [Rotaria sordida]
MEYSCIELNDIPDEVLLIIFQKLNNIDVLYSLHGVNKQLNKIIRDPIFTTSLNFVKWSSNKFLNKLSSNVILNRFCLQILPDISIKIKWFHRESSSIKRILHAANDPNLYGLGLYNMKEKTARRLFIEKLGLYITTYVRDTFIDGNYLKKNIFNRMPQLNEFSFDFRSLLFINNQINFPSNEDIQRTFTDFQYNKIISYVNHFLEENQAQCHVYSYPSQIQYYQRITNHFSGGIFKYVRLISLYDEHPFEHEFFIRISQSFPFIEKLSLINNQSQKHKQSHNSSIVKYNYLVTLDIEKVHDDYLEEFLFNRKTYFHNNILVYINYKSLERVTHNFTRDSTRINCGKINKIYFWGEKNYSNSLRDYFPQAIIS